MWNVTRLVGKEPECGRWSYFFFFNSWRGDRLLFWSCPGWAPLGGCGDTHKPPAGHCCVGVLPGEQEGRIAEVSEVVKKLLSGKVLGVDEISHEMLKALDIVGLSQLTRLLCVTWRLGTVPVEWQNGMVVPIFKQGGRRVCSNYRSITWLPTWESLLQGAGREAPTDWWTLDPGGAM